MKITTRGRYALRIMLYMADHGGEGPHSIRRLSGCIHVSPKYLEQIVSPLVRGGLINVSRGNAGGYSLNRSPEEYTAWEILCAVEGELSPLSGLDCYKNVCEYADECLSIPLWEGLDRVIREYLQTRTLRNILEERRNDPLT